MKSSKIFYLHIVFLVVYCGLLQHKISQSIQWCKSPFTIFFCFSNVKTEGFVYSLFCQTIFIDLKYIAVYIGVHNIHMFEVKCK